MGILLYSEDHEGKLPQSLAEMVGPYFEEMPVSPRAKRLGRFPATGGPAGSFVYLRPAEKMDAIVSPALTVMAYTPLEYHEDTGMTVLFCDGHCVWIDRAEAQALLGELQAGHNPLSAQGH
jgi:prepilin-type processing-associated H-X9-DG protein